MRTWFSFLILLLSVCSLWAGGGPLNTLVIVNRNSQESMQVGQYYQAVRGLPADHICYVQAETNNPMLLADFESQIWGPVTSWMAERGMDEQVDTLVLSRGFPYTIRNVIGTKTNDNGVTSVLYYGFHGYPALTACELPSPTFHDYFESEQAFSQDTYLESGYRMRLAAALEAYTLEESLTLIDRSVAADSSFPAGRVELVKTSDPFRNVRWTQHEDTDFAMKLLPNDVEVDIHFTSNISGKTNLIGVSIGAVTVPGLLNNDFEPGCIGDHLTSYGGVLDGLGGRGAWMCALSPTSVTGTVALPVTNWANGTHRLTLVARGGDETASQHLEDLFLVVSNSVFDVYAVDFTPPNQVQLSFQSGSSYVYQVETPLLDTNMYPVSWISVDTVTASSATTVWTNLNVGVSPL